MAPDAGPDTDVGIELDADSEVELEHGRWDLQGAGDVAVREGVLQVVCGDGVLHDVEIRGALEQMLALAARVFGAHLLAVYALHGQALVLLLRPELDKGSVHVLQRRRRDAGEVRLARGFGARPRWWCWWMWCLCWCCLLLLVVRVRVRVRVVVMVVRMVGVRSRRWLCCYC